MTPTAKIILAGASAILLGSLVLAIVLLSAGRRHYRNAAIYGCKGETPCKICRTCTDCQHCAVRGGTCGVKRAATTQRGELLTVKR